MAAPRQYGTYMPYVKPVAKKPVRQTNPYAPWDPNSGLPPTPPGVDVINKLYPQYPDHSEAEWEKLLNARVKPYEQAIGKVRDIDEGRAEFQFEQARDANQALSTGFANLLMGGRSGEEGAQFAKENFGGQYMPLEAMSIAHQHLADLTSDWNDRDWEISSQYQKAMAEVPGLKEQMRESISKQDTDEYTRNFNMANLYLDEMWNVYNANAKQYNTNQQLAAARTALGIKGYDNRKDAVAEMTKQAAQSKYKWGVRRASDGSWEAYQTTQLKPVKPGSKTNDDIKYRNSAISEAKYRTSAGPTIWEIFKDPKQGWVARDTGKKKAPGKGKGSSLSDAQRAENDLANKLFDEKEKYVGVKETNPLWTNTLPNKRKGIPQFTTKGGVDYNTAFSQFYDYAYQILSQYGRSDTYIRNWVRARLDALYPGSKANSAKPRGG